MRCEIQSNPRRPRRVVVAADLRDASDVSLNLRLLLTRLSDCPGTIGPK